MTHLVNPYLDALRECWGYLAFIAFIYWLGRSEEE